MADDTAKDAKKPTADATALAKPGTAKIVDKVENPNLAAMNGTGPKTTVTADPKREYVAGGPYVLLSSFLRSLPPYIDDISEEFGDDIYERMLKDPQVASDLLTVKLNVLASGWRLIPAVDKDDPKYDKASKIADFCTAALGQMSTPLNDVLMDMLDALALGNRVAEMVYHVPETGALAGKLTLKAIKPKPRRAIAMVADAMNNVKGFLALLPGNYAPLLMGSLIPAPTAPNFLPREKFAILSFMPKNGDMRGTSLLRPAYTPWWLKMQGYPGYLKFMALFAVPGLIGTTAEKAKAQQKLDKDGSPVFDDATGEPKVVTPEEVLLDRLLQFANASAIAIPFGAKIDPLQAKGENIPFPTFIDLCNREISKAITGQTLATMEGQNMSRAAAETHQDTGSLIVRYTKTVVEQMLRHDVCRLLVRYNFGQEAEELTPKVSLTETEQHDFSTDATAISGLYTAGYLDVSQIAETDSWLGLPARTKEEIDARAAVQDAKNQSAIQQAQQAAMPQQEDPGTGGGDDSTADAGAGQPSLPLDPEPAAAKAAATPKKDATTAKFATALNPAKAALNALFGDDPEDADSHWVMIHGHPVKVQGKPLSGPHEIKQAIAQHVPGAGPNVFTALHKAFQSGDIKTDTDLHHAIAIAHAAHEVAVEKGAAPQGSVMGGASAAVGASYGHINALKNAVGAGDPAAAKLIEKLQNAVSAQAPSGAAAAAEVAALAPHENEHSGSANVPHEVKIDGNTYYATPGSPISKQDINAAAQTFDLDPNAKTALNKAMADGTIKDHADVLHAIALAKAAQGLAIEAGKTKAGPIGKGSMAKAVQYVHLDVAKTAAQGGDAYAQQLYAKAAPAFAYAAPKPPEAKPDAKDTGMSPEGTDESAMKEGADAEAGKDAQGNPAGTFYAHLTDKGYVPVPGAIKTTIPVPGLGGHHFFVHPVLDLDGKPVAGKYNLSEATTGHSIVKDEPNPLAALTAATDKLSQPGAVDKFAAALAKARGAGVASPFMAPQSEAAPVEKPAEGAQAQVPAQSGGQPSEGQKTALHGDFKPLGAPTEHYSHKSPEIVDGNGTKHDIWVGQKPSPWNGKYAVNHFQQDAKGQVLPGITEHDTAEGAAHHASEIYAQLTGGDLQDPFAEDAHGNKAADTQPAPAAAETKPALPEHWQQSHKDMASLIHGQGTGQVIRVGDKYHAVAIKPGTSGGAEGGGGASLAHNALHDTKQEAIDAVHGALGIKAPEPEEETPEGYTAHGQGATAMYAKTHPETGAVLAVGKNPATGDYSATVDGADGKEIHSSSGHATQQEAVDAAESAHEAYQQEAKSAPAPAANESAMNGAGAGSAAVQWKVDDAPGNYTATHANGQGGSIVKDAQGYHAIHTPGAGADEQYLGAFDTAKEAKSAIETAITGKAAPAPAGALPEGHTAQTPKGEHGLHVWDANAGPSGQHVPATEGKIITDEPDLSTGFGHTFFTAKTPDGSGYKVYETKSGGAVINTTQDTPQAAIAAAKAVIAHIGGTPTKEAIDAHIGAHGLSPYDLHQATTQLLMGGGDPKDAFIHSDSMASAHVTAPDGSKHVVLAMKAPDALGAYAGKYSATHIGGAIGGSATHHDTAEEAFAAAQKKAQEVAGSPAEAAGTAGAGTGEAYTSGKALHPAFEQTDLAKGHYTHKVSTPDHHGTDGIWVGTEPLTVGTDAGKYLTNEGTTVKGGSEGFKAHDTKEEAIAHANALLAKHSAGGALPAAGAGAAPAAAPANSPQSDTITVPKLTGKSIDEHATAAGWKSGDGYYKSWFKGDSGKPGSVNVQGWKSSYDGKYHVNYTDTDGTYKEETHNTLLQAMKAGNAKYAELNPDAPQIVEDGTKPAKTPAGSSTAAAATPPVPGATPAVPKSKKEPNPDEVEIGAHDLAPLPGSDAGALSPEAKAAADATPLGGHHVTVGGKQLPVTDAAPITPAHIQQAISHLSMTDKGKEKVQNWANTSSIKTVGQLHEKLAIAEASSKAAGVTTIGGTSLNAANAYSGIKDLKDKAIAGDATAKELVKNLSPHTLKSAGEVQAEMDAAAKDKAASLSHEFVMAKSVSGQAGSNTGGVYEDKDGNKHYVKLYKDPKQAHGEHVANAIYNALGIAAPQSSVFTGPNGKAAYASSLIDKKGDVGSLGLTEAHAKEALKGFAADVLLGNWDAYGASGDNMSVGKDGKLYRIDNGGTLLHRAQGDLKSQDALDHIHEWENFATPGQQYHTLMQKAGVKKAEDIGGVVKQIQNIEKLRAQHGGWENFIKQAAPKITPAHAKQIAAILEARTKQLSEKRKEITGNPSLVGVRDFAFEGEKHHEYQQIKKFQEKFQKHLTPEQKDAVVQFKGSGYTAMNDILRKGNKGSPQMQALVKHFKEAYSHPDHVLGKDFILSRNIYLKPGSEAFKKYINADEGAEISDPGGQSHSHNPLISVGGTNVQFKVHAPKETPALNPSLFTTSNEGENEQLLPPGTTYRILKVHAPDTQHPEDKSGWHWKSGHHQVEVEVVVPGIND